MFEFVFPAVVKVLPANLAITQDFQGSDEEGLGYVNLDSSAHPLRTRFTFLSKAGWAKMR